MDLEQVIRKYIDKSLHMSLATVSNSKPWVCEVHFVYDENLNLYWRSIPSRRHSKEIAANPSVAGNIIRQHTVDEEPEGIYFEGKAEIVEDAEEQRTILPLFVSRLSCNEDIIKEAKKPHGHQFYKVTIENWSAFGRFGGKSVEKYEINWSGSKQNQL